MSVGEGKQLARISSARLGFESHGILTVWLMFEGEGWGVGFGGYAYRTGKDDDKRHRGYDGAPAATIHTILQGFEADDWSDLPGKLAWVWSGGWGGKVEKIQPVRFDGQAAPEFTFEAMFEKDEPA